MEEDKLRSLIGDVRDGRMSRRGFIARMASVGFTAPMAGMLLAQAGVAFAQAQPAYKPTKAGGGGPLKILFWQAPPCSIRISPPAPRTRTARASSTSRSPAGTRTATSSRTSPPRSRARRMAALSADGTTVTWKLKRGVKWHDGKPFTADDVVFTWEYAVDPATAATTTGSYKDIKVEKVDDHTVKVDLQAADAVLGRPLRRRRRHDHPEASLRRLQGRQVARGAGQPQAGRHRPLQVRRLQARRHPARRAQRRLPHRRTSRISTRSRSRAAAMPSRRRARCSRPASSTTPGTCRSRTRSSSAWRRAGAARSARFRAATSSSSSSTPPIRGPRSTASARSVKTKHPTLTDPTVRQAINLLIDRDSIQKFIYGRGGVATASFVNEPDAVQVAQAEIRVQHRQGEQDPRRRRLEARRRRHPREGRQEAQIRLPDLDQRTAPEDAGDHQAGLPEGRHRPRAQVGHGLGVLLVGRRQSRHLHEALLRHGDVHDDAAAARSGALPQPVRLLGGRQEGEQVAGPQHLALSSTRRPTKPTRRRRRSSIRSSAPRSSSRSNEIFCEANVILPLLSRTRVAACGNTLVPNYSGWDADLWTLDSWYREA